MAYVKIENNIVVQKQPNAAEGFIWAPNDVVCGYIVDGQGFAPPPVIIDKLDVLATYRLKKETGGITVSGAQILTDRETQGILDAASRKAEKNLETPGWGIQWKAANGWVLLSAAQIVAIGDLVFNHVQKCFATERTVALYIDHYDTIEEIQSAFDSAFNS